MEIMSMTHTYSCFETYIYIWYMSLNQPFETRTITLGGIPYAFAHCQFFFSFARQRRSAWYAIIIINCLVSKIHCLANQNKPYNGQRHRVSHHVIRGRLCQLVGLLRGLLTFAKDHHDTGCIWWFYTCKCSITMKQQGRFHLKISPYFHPIPFYIVIACRVP